MKNAKKLNIVKGYTCEVLACFILRLKGYRVLKRNFKQRNTAQIDILAEKNNKISLIEVKYRKQFSNCIEAISLGQKQRIKLSAFNISKKYKKEVTIDGMFFAKEAPFFKHKKNIF
ncbi:MAG: YraN family protein [Proteobacteria bacterium]|nr:YraN family protein [Pseudomonadota bacterium]